MSVRPEPLAQERKGAVTVLAVATMAVNCVGATLSLGGWFHAALILLFLVAVSSTTGAYRREHERALEAWKAAEAKRKEDAP